MFNLGCETFDAKTGFIVVLIKRFSAHREKNDALYLRLNTSWRVIIPHIMFPLFIRVSHLAVQNDPFPFLSVYVWEKGEK